jgi:hypothetical protein
MAYPNKEQWVESLVQLVVARARVLINDARTWERYRSALDQNGRDVPLTSPDAVRFCAQAALTRASYDIVGTCFPELDYRKLAYLAGDCIAAYDVLGDINARRGRTRILKLMDAFLAREKFERRYSPGAFARKRSKPKAETAAQRAGSVRSTRARSRRGCAPHRTHTKNTKSRQLTITPYTVQSSAQGLCS